MVQEQSQKRGTYLGLSAKLVIGFTFVFSLVFGIAYYWFFTFATDMAISRVEEDLKDTLNAAATGVDAPRFTALIEDVEPVEGGYPEDERYWSHVEWLGQVATIEPRAAVYTYIAGEKGDDVYFIGSSGAVAVGPSGDQPPWGATFREYCETGPDCGDFTTNLNAISTRRFVPDDFYTDQWGSWISGYLPIINVAGEAIGGIGIDFDAGYVSQVQQNILNTVVIAFVITYVALFILVYLLSRTFTRPIRQLTTAAQQIGEGNYDQDLTSLINVRLRDEISSLTQVFSDMADKVYQREVSLKKQVEELRIEIDEVKAQQQVSEIVDSDFFEHLQDKVKTMRDRKQKGADLSPGAEPT